MTILGVSDPVKSHGKSSIWVDDLPMKLRVELLKVVLPEGIWSHVGQGQPVQAEFENQNDLLAVSTRHKMCMNICLSWTQIAICNSFGGPMR